MFIGNGNVATELAVRVQSARSLRQMELAIVSSVQGCRVRVGRPMISISIVALLHPKWWSVVVSDGVEGKERKRVGRE
ncbi:hypothetical protein ES702_01587 [subsurface metagenome]